MKSKMKTKKSLLRRVKITATGKILHASNFTGHLKRSKSRSQLRRLKRTKTFSRSLNIKIKKRLGVS
jgi:large subunit ribosomal protein L35